MVRSAQGPLLSHILLSILGSLEVWSSKKSFCSYMAAHFTDGETEVPERLSRPGLLSLGVCSWAIMDWHLSLS